MKYTLKIIFTIILFIFSIYYTKQLITIIQTKDPLMQEIISKKTKYEQVPLDAIITKKTVIPGKIGKKIAINESYQKMKKLGYFDESLLIYETIKPNTSYINKFDKIIIPNKKNDVSLIFIINNNTIFENINTILENNNTKGNILNNNYLTKNTSFINILSTTYNKNSDFCLTFDLTIDNNCIKNKKYTILSKNNIITKHYLTTTKNQINNNNIFIYNFNENLTDLPLIIKYLKNNNYNIVSIDELIDENI